MDQARVRAEPAGTAGQNGVSERLLAPSQKPSKRNSVMSSKSGSSSIRTKSVRSSTYSTFSVSSRGTLASTNTSIDPNDFDDWVPPEIPERPKTGSREVKSGTKQLLNSLELAAFQSNGQNGVPRRKRQILAGAVMQINYLQKNTDRLQANYNVLLQGCKDAASAHNARSLAFEALKAENEALKRQLRKGLPKPPAVALPPIPGPLSGDRSKNAALSPGRENVPKDEDHHMSDTGGKTPSMADLVNIESIVAESTRKTINSVMGTFEEMMGLEPSPSEPGSEDEAFTEDSASIHSIDEHDDVQCDGLDLQTQHQNNESRLGQDVARGVSTDHTPQQSHTNPARPQAGKLAAQESRKRIRINSPTEENDDGNQKRQRAGSAKKPSTEEYSKKFACPYHKRWPEIQPKHQSCVFPGFSNVSRVKEHLYRAHALRIQCQRCYHSFDDGIGLTQHLTEPGQCPGVGEQTRFGFTLAQEKELKKKKRGMSEEQKWIAVYRILFKDDEEAMSNIPSPYWEYATGHSQRQSHNTSEWFAESQAQLLAERVLERVTQLAQAAEAISMEILSSRLPDIIRDVQDQLRSTSRQVPGHNSQSPEPPSGEPSTIGDETDNIFIQRSFVSGDTGPLRGHEIFESATQSEPHSLDETLYQQPRPQSIPDNRSADSGYGSAERASQASPTVEEGCPQDDRSISQQDINSNSNACGTAENALGPFENYGADGTDSGPAFPQRPQLEDHQDSSATSDYEWPLPPTTGHLCPIAESDFNFGLPEFNFTDAADDFSNFSFPETSHSPPSGSADVTVMPDPENIGIAFSRDFEAPARTGQPSARDFSTAVPPIPTRSPARLPPNGEESSAATGATSLASSSTDPLSQGRLFYGFPIPGSPTLGQEGSIGGSVVPGEHSRSHGADLYAELVRRERGQRLGSRP